ncbi:carbohydrate ABC transporter permease [Streptomyces sp. NPDC090106]|uniref:carbohydrate ABC transporter permease n=1 Tax=Streptomyces sp. NPDC090106 TaxID=3365946 RepID=UPI00382312ED
MKSVLGDRRAILLLIGPSLLLYSLITLVPLVWSLGYMFFHGSIVTGFQFAGLSNFSTFLSDPNAHSALWFTVKYAVLLTVCQVAMGYLLALMYYFWLQSGSALIRTLVFFPVVLPTVAVALLFQQVFQTAPTTGPANAAIESVGMSAPDWFGSGGTAFWVILLMDVWRSMGFYAVLLFAGIVDIPQDVLESARLDGASGAKLIRHMVLPLTAPVLLSAVIFSINGTLKVFDSVLALTNGGPGFSTTPLTLYMYQTAFTYGDYGYGSTLAFVLTLLCLIVTVFVFRAQRREIV